MFLGNPQTSKPDCFFKILGSIRINFGQEIVQLKTNISNLFFVLLRMVETIFDKMLI